jgi:DNA-binding XRE family transcriptional regulator
MYSLFEDLMEAYERGDLILKEGGMCHFHRSRRNPGVIRINVIISTRPGVGSQMLEELKALPGVREIRASCPADLPANAWYAKKNFTLASTRLARTGRKLNDWVLYLTPQYHTPDQKGGENMHKLLVMRAVRQMKGLTQKALGTMAGIHPVEISLIEARRWVPTQRTLEKLAEVLEVSPDDLLKPYDEWVREKLQEEGR